MSTVKKHNPLLEKVRMPGSTFRLPSGAEFYKQGEVELENSNKAEVYVSPMTTMDEITITSLDKLLNGTAVDEVFGRCIPAVKDTRSMLASDVDYLMVALRIVSFGRETDVDITHTCKDTKKYTYVINVEDQILDKTVPLTAATIKAYRTDLSNGLHVQFTPLTYQGLLDVQSKLDRIQSLQDKRSRLENGDSTQDEIASKIVDATHDYLIELLTNAVDTIDGIDDREMIEEALMNMSISLREEMVDAYNGLAEWGQPKTITVKCKDCKKDMDIKLDLNPVSFFTTRSRPKTLT